MSSNLLRLTPGIGTRTVVLTSGPGNFASESLFMRFARWVNPALVAALCSVIDRFRELSNEEGEVSSSSLFSSASSLLSSEGERFPVHLPQQVSDTSHLVIQFVRDQHGQVY